MRLLQCNPDGGFTRTEDLPGNEDLEYAILSHRWESEEITFKDLVDGTDSDKAGYEKLRFCAKQAIRDGLRYFWVDTCCIDKSNQVELNEAIISMFRWYYKAVRCYVYLSDVSVVSGRRKRKREQSELPWEPLFRASKWFTRGWTLQELLAPVSVEFFTREGQRLGDKKSLEQLVHEITGIATSALQGTDLSRFEVDERFEWAKSRQTTREEDWAYCLLGIFGVSMPALYGEGKGHAIRRLRNEINSNLSPGRSFVLDKLPAADGAAFDSQAEGAAPTCHRDTRVDLLRQIREWADQPGGQPQVHAIFWLNGMAGTGKSTISRTVARHFAENRRLGASFFFKRGNGDRGKTAKFFTTIAAQLVSAVPTVAVHVKNAIESDPSVVGKVMQEQFEKLIFDPLSQITPDTSQALGLIIVVDALDECERDEDVKLIINLFSRVNRLTSLSLRILVTSRPELPIRLGFRKIHGKYQDLVLHEIPEPVVAHDISTFLQFELARIRDEYNASVTKERQLASGWPDQSTIRILVKMAVPLFIFAATVCRFLADRKCGNPDKKLRQVLEYRTKSQESKLDNTYLPVLEQLLIDVSGREKAQVLDRFRVVIGSIINLASPLSTHSLAQMLNVSLDDIDNMLDWLHSVLSVPPASRSPVQLLHLSFRDFLLDPEKRETNLFWVDEQQTHKLLAAHCLRVMSQCLRIDICRLQAPATSRLAISLESIQRSLPSEVQYACLYWVYHVEQSKTQPCDGDQVHKFLCRNFVQWLEALSVIGRASESISILKTLQSLVQVNTQLFHFLNDAIRLVLANTLIIDSAPLQVYSSVLTFAPQRSIVRGKFEKVIPNWISLRPESQTNWSQCLQILEGHSGYVSSVAFSHDSALITSAADDKTVRLWRTDTGECIQELQGHSGSVNSVAFSHDSALIASAADDKTVRLWRTDMGECIQELQGHSGYVSSVAFSHDSALIASASWDNTVRLWRTDTGECIQELQGHSGYVSSVAFSHDSALIASASWDNTVRLWRTDTGECIQELQGHSRAVKSVAFSHDSALIASAADDRTVRLWRTDTGECIQELQGHSGSVKSVTFSHNSALIASAAYDRTVLLWRTDTGECIQELQGHSGAVNSVAFSHDSALITSAADDRTVRLWRTDTGECIQELQGHSSAVNSVTFSHDSALIASAAYDRTVRLWRTDTGECIQELQGHSHAVKSVTFSHDSALITSAADDRTVRLWRTDTGECIQELQGHSGYVKSVTFSHDSALIASAAYDNTVRLWRTETGECVQELQGHSGYVNFVAFSHDSALIASAADDRTVRLWRTDAGECIQELQGHSGSVNSVTFSHDSALIASAADDRTVRLWRTDTGECIQELQGHSGSVNSVAFSHDSALIASAAYDNTVRLWRTDTGKCVQETVMGKIVKWLSFEPDSSQVVTSLGTIAIAKLPLVAQTTTDKPPTAQAVTGLKAGHCFGYGFSPDSCWITWH